MVKFWCKIFGHKWVVVECKDYIHLEVRKIVCRCKRCADYRDEYKIIK